MSETSSGEVASPEAAGDEGDAAFTMQNWLDQGSDLKTLRRGEVIEGTVMAVQRDGVLIDTGSKSEGIVPPNEMQSMGSDPLSKVSVGEKLLVYVMQPEAEQGHVMLSIDRARGERGWRLLQTRYDEGEAFDGEVSGFNKGGLLVNVEGVHAFVPLSQVVGVRPDREASDGGLGAAVGKTLRLKVIEINRRRNRVILSERAALQEWRSQQKDRLLAELKEGEIRKGRVSSVRNFGVFVDLGGADGLAHQSEVSWDRNKTPEEMYHVGDEVDVYIMKVDAETKKIALSLRRAQPEQWDLIVDRYQVGRVVPGVVTKLVAFGAFARIEGPVEGLIHVSELVDRRIAHPKEVVREGDLLPLKIVRIERDRHRLGLSLREAREDGERLGFRFTDAGEVISVPDDIRREFEEREGVSVQQPTTSAVESAPPAEAAAPAAEAPAESAEPAEGAAGERPARGKAKKEQSARAEPEPVSAIAAAFERAEAAKSDDDATGSAPVDETPADETIAAGAPADEATAVEAPADQATTVEGPADEMPTDEATAADAPADEATDVETPSGEALAEGSSAEQEAPGEAQLVEAAAADPVVEESAPAEPERIEDRAEPETVEAIRETADEETSGDEPEQKSEET